MDGENGFSGGYPGYSNGFSGFPGFSNGFPGLQNGFPGFQNGFPGSPGGFAGSMNGSLDNGNPAASSPAANSGFLSGGNLDFSKMAAMVKSRQEQQLKDGTYSGTYGGKNGRPASKTDMLEELKRIRKGNKEGRDKQDHLMSTAKVLQARIARNNNKPGSMWDQKLEDEMKNTDPLEAGCKALRNELDEQHKIRMESFEIKMKPIIIKDGPSKKANFKIQAAKLQYEIYSLSQRLRYTTFRAENEEKRRDTVEREVRHLRDKISLFKIQISTITKGVPMSKIEVREDKRSNARSPDREDKRSMSLPASSKSPERTISPPLKHTAHILKSQQSLASEILA